MIFADTIEHVAGGAGARAGGEGDLELTPGPARETCEFPAPGSVDPPVNLERP